MTAKYSETKKKWTSPGSYIFTGIKKAEKTSITLISYNSEDYSLLEIDSPADILRNLKEANVNWINISGLHDTAKIEQIGNALNIHPLTLEDILNTSHSPKYENFVDYAFIVAKMIDVGPDKNVNIEQISFVLGKNFLVSFLEDPQDVFNVVRDRIENNLGRIRSNGTDYLLYRLLDTIVDNYYTVLEVFEDKIEMLDNLLVPGKQRSSLEPVYQFRKELLHFRKAVYPLLETILAFERERENFIGKSTYLFLRDLNDHIKYIYNSIETYHEMITSMIEVYMSLESHRLNEVIKVLTIISTIFMPLTFIVGVYGMNFNTRLSPWNMPELNWFYGYVFIWIVMIAVTAGLIFFFKRKKWF